MTEYSEQIDRITAAKAAIEAAIIEKGVDVPDGTTLDGIAALIASIQSGGGGGLPEGISALASGTITPASDYSSFTYEATHNLGVVCNFAALILVDPLSSTAYANMMIATYAIFKNNSNRHPTVYYYYNSSKNVSANHGETLASFWGTNYVKFMTPYTLKAGKTYRWVCGVIDDLH